MTTKADLLRDNLIDLLKGLELVESDTQMYNLVEHMLDAFDDNEVIALPASNMDFKVKVIIEGRK